MKIRNDTKYESAGLREVIRRVADVELDAGKRKRMVVAIKETVRGISRSDEFGKSVLGYCATFGGSHCTVYLPTNPKNLDAVMFAHTVAHEFAHCRGMTHADMRGNPRYMWVRDRKNVSIVKREIGVETTTRLPDRVGWFEVAEKFVDGVELRVKPKRTKPKPADEHKIVHLEDLISKWETKKKMAETAIKKYRKKVRYYHRKIAAKPAGGGDR